MRLQTEDTVGAEGSSVMEGYSRRRNATSGRLDVAETLGRTLGAVDFLRETPGSFGTCHHPDASQIVTTKGGLHSISLTDNYQMKYLQTPYVPE